MTLKRTQLKIVRARKSIELILNQLYSSHESRHDHAFYNDPNREVSDLQAPNQSPEETFNQLAAFWGHAPSGKVAQYWLGLFKGEGSPEEVEVAKDIRTMIQNTYPSQVTLYRATNTPQETGDFGQSWTSIFGDAWAFAMNTEPNKRYILKTSLPRDKIIFDEAGLEDLDFEGEIIIDSRGINKDVVWDKESIEDPWAEDQLQE